MTPFRKPGYGLTAPTRAVSRIFGGWLTAVVARVCLDMLRSRRSRREEPLETPTLERTVSRENGGDPEAETLLADSVGLALLVTLDRLTPAERLAFVLHDVFDLPFEEIAPIVNRSPTAARQLASRARRRVRGTTTMPDADLTRQRKVVEAFLSASRGGDFDALLAVLDPDIAFQADHSAVQAGGPREANGAPNVARLFSGRAQAARPALVNGAIGIVVAPQGRLFLTLIPTIANGKIVRIEAIADPERLRQLNLGVLHEG